MIKNQGIAWLVNGLVDFWLVGDLCFSGRLEMLFGRDATKVAMVVAITIVVAIVEVAV